MGVTVGIVDPAATFRSGLSRALLEAGFEPCDIDDPGAPMPFERPGALLWTVRRPQDWKALAAHQGGGRELVVVALVVEPTPETYVEAFRSGVDAAVPWEAAPDVILRVLAAALDGNVLIPRDVERALVSQIPVAHDPDWTSGEELGWLRALAEGATVHDLAETAGYSERALYRLLHALYGKMGVSNRTEAILQANRWGLLD